MDTINTSTQSGGHRMRYNVSTSVPKEVAAFFPTVGSTVLKLNLKLKLEIALDHISLKSIL
jgi:hypothetical protein